MKTIIAAAAFAALALGATELAHAMLGSNSKLFNGIKLNGGTENGRELNASSAGGATEIRGFEVTVIMLPAEATPAPLRKDQAQAFFGHTCPVWQSGWNGTSLTGSILETE